MLGDIVFKISEEEGEREGEEEEEGDEVSVEKNLMNFRPYCRAVVYG